MYAEKRDRGTSPDENLGRWIIGGVVLLALAAGAWFWLKRGSEAPEAPAAPPPVAAEPAIKNPIVAPDDIDPNLSATEQVATLIGTPRFEAHVRAGRVREEAGRDGRQPRAFRRRRPHEPGEGARRASS